MKAATDTKLGGFAWRCFDTCETPADCMMDGCKKGLKDEEKPTPSRGRFMKGSSYVKNQNAHGA